MRTPPKPKPREYGPEISPEENTVRAKKALARLKELDAEIRVDRMAQRKLLAIAVGQPKETDRSRLIWKGLEQYVNAEYRRGEPAGSEVTNVLRAVIALCVGNNTEFRDMEGETFLNLEGFSDVEQVQERGRVSVDVAFACLATELLPSFRLLLSWLADPNRMDPLYRTAALRFLTESNEEVPAPYSYEINKRFDETGKEGGAHFYSKDPSTFLSVSTPITRFIYERVERYHNQELKLREAVPIILCKRQGCGKLSFVQRSTKDFCSSSCRTLHRQKTNPVGYAAYMRQWREDNY